MAEQFAFKISADDNVATALEGLCPGSVYIRGELPVVPITAIEEIPVGHKISLANIPAGGDIVKYGVVIGCATADIETGRWVHLHCMKSTYDERSSHLDVVSGAPLDIKYE